MFVIAKKFGDRIIVHSDTMISSENPNERSVVPGSLKILILSESVSVAYAGNVTRALDKIRSASRLLQSGVGLEGVLEALCQATTDGACEFIVVSHFESAQLFRIFDGVISEDLAETKIGNLGVANHFLPTSIAQLDPQSSILGLPDLERLEIEFNSGFKAPFLQSTQITEDVGGVPISLTGSPNGHCYSGYAFVRSWESIKLPIGLTKEQAENQKSGMTSWSVHGHGPSVRGIALFGVYLEQAGLGWIYDPLVRDDPELIAGISYTQFVEIVESRASIHSSDRAKTQISDLDGQSTSGVEYAS